MASTNSKSKLKEYSFHVISEIFLVTIGILIALKINNWNDHNKKLENLEVAYEQLLESLAEDSVSIRQVIVEHQKASEAARVSLYHLDEKKAWNADLTKSIMTSDNLKLFVPQTATFEAIKISGIELIENPKLKRQLFAVYERHTRRHRKREEIIKHIRNNYCNIWLTQNFKTSGESPHTWEFRNYENVLNDTAFLGNLGVLIWRQFDVVETATDLSIEIKVLRRLIEKELKALRENKDQIFTEKCDLNFQLSGFSNAEKVTLRCIYPDKSDHKLDMKNEHGFWVKNIETPQNGYYLYRYNVDGVWVDIDTLDQYPIQSGGQYSVKYCPF